MLRPIRSVLAPVAVAAVVLTTFGLAAAPALDPVDPSDDEQLGIYELNLARHDPGAYGDRIGLDLSDVSAEPPLALNRRLVGSARFHVDEMRDHDYFAHTSAVTGDGPNQMAVDHGYDLFGDGTGADWGDDNFIESLAYGFNMWGTAPEALAGLIVDEGVPGVGHRVHLLAMNSFFRKHREIGVGRSEIGSKVYFAYHTAYVSSSDTFVTGVVYDDANQNRRYDGGEGMAGVTVSVGGRSDVTGSAGGYAVPVTPGSDTVTCSGGSFSIAATATITVGDDNVEVDFRRGRTRGDVSFAAHGGATILATEIEATPARGDAPLTVAFDAWCEDPTATASWDFGDGGTSSDASTVHEYADHGVYPVILRTQSGDGDGAAVAIMSVDDPAGAGPGTTAPASTALDTRKLKIKVKHKRVGRDKIQLKARLTMPEGFVAGEHPVEICIGPVRVAFTIDRKGKGRLVDGSKIKLKWSRPGDGAPIGAGVVAKLEVKLRGDLAQRLTAAGLRNADENRTHASFPYGLDLSGLTYEGSVDLDIRSKAGSKSKARMAD